MNEIEVLQTDWRARLHAAEELFRAGAWPDAETAYRAVMAGAPDQVPGYVGAARCARQRGDRLASLDYLRAAVAAVPGDAWPRLEMAVDFTALGQLDESDHVYRDLLAIMPDCAAAHRGLGQSARQRGDRARALAHFQEAVAAAPADAWANFDAATELRELGQIDAAEAILKNLLASQPASFLPSLGLGHCARQRGDRAASLAHFQAAVAAAPMEVWPHLECAIDLTALARFDEAAATYRDLLVMDPGSVAAHRGLGQCARQSGDRAAALRHFQDAAAAAPDDNWARFDAATELRELGRLNEAEAMLRALPPGNFHGHLGLGHCARQRGDRAAAISHFQAAAAAAPADPWPRLETALDLVELGRLDEAEQIYRDLLTIVPGCAAAHRGLGNCARQRGARDLAWTHIQNAIAADPNDPDSWLDLATAERDRGDFAAARQTAETVLRNHPKNLAAMLSIGFTEHFAGNAGAALAAFAAAGRIHPGNPGIIVQMAQQERALGRPAACDVLIAQALERDPRDLSAILLRGEQAMIAEDHDAALEIFTAAAAAQPDQIAFPLGMVDALVALGRVDDALAALAALATRFGARPRIISKRVNLLHQIGDYTAALPLIRQATREPGHDFQLSVDRVRMELLAGTDADITAALGEVHATTLAEETVRRRLAGNIAEAAWQPEEAIRHYEAAAAMMPREPWIQFELVKVKLLTLDIAGALRNLRQFAALNATLLKQQGKSTNISQTHYGQILDDYRLDQDLLDQLTPLQAFPPLQRAPALLKIALENPDSSAAAISLMVALRQAGALDGAGTPAQLNAIPKTLTQFWDTVEPPPDIAKLMQSWRDHNPGYSFQLFNERTAVTFLEARYPQPVQLAYRRIREPAQKADLFRLAYLLAGGGVYADADDRCLAGLDSIIPDDATLVTYQEDHGTLGNNFIAAAPNHPVIAEALRAAVNAMNRGDTDYVWLATGPALLTRAFVRHLRAVGETVALPVGAVVLDRRALFSAVAIHCAAVYKKTRRHWSNAAFTRRAKPNDAV